MTNSHSEASSYPTRHLLHELGSATSRLKALRNTVTWGAHVVRGILNLTDSHFKPRTDMGLATGLIMAANDDIVRTGQEDRTEPCHGEIVMALGTSLATAEKTFILRTLELVRGNRAHASRVLGISTRGLHLKLKQYGVPRITHSSLSDEVVDDIHRRLRLGESKSFIARELSIPRLRIWRLLSKQSLDSTNHLSRLE